MFDKLFQRFQAEEPEANAETQLELAFAALLVEAARIDENYDESEVAIIDRALMKRFSLDGAEAAALRARAEAAQANATDIQRFTKIAKAMSREEKVELIEELWEIVLSDGARDPYEETLLRQICGLIYVDDQDSGAARARVAARLK
ncbi:tellurite resistance TerB family protein [Hyphococcus sp.]|uniref:tellurite resistance TerB family protein n=1 Tax=Hyphococcus sp. TaxID=2038636 RepID=UPI0035C6A3A6